MLCYGYMRGGAIDQAENMAPGNLNVKIACEEQAQVFAWNSKMWVTPNSGPTDSAGLLYASQKREKKTAVLFCYHSKRNLDVT
mmetsp:Transcript_30054/g.44274  ORF Transcript_30054/g.44274 Transcript_30054/m.44274 type:complete len:83 (-) Transcript_30054:592-840(-)